MTDYPLAIILYQGGTAGDFLKALCNSQLTGIDYLKMKGSRVALDNWSFKDTPNYNGAYAVENTHRLDIIEAWPQSDWYWISVPYHLCGTVAKWLITKTDCADFDEFKLKHPGWLQGLQQQHGKVDSWSDFIKIETQTIHGWIASLAHYMGNKRFIEISLSDMIDRNACKSVVELITKRRLMHPDIYAMQHDTWSSLNQGFISDLLKSPGDL